jgi:hypothetical protein
LLVLAVWKAILVWEDTRALESIRCCFVDGLQDGPHGVLDELAASHFVLNISHVKVSVE